MKKILYCKPYITEIEHQFVADAIKHGWGESCYHYIEQFEELFKNHLSVNYAIATSSCTGALHMGLAALNIGPGDEVIIADTNWVASVAPICYLGATPILVDVDKDSWCINPEKIEKAITEKTKAIIAVHLYGNMCDLAALQGLSKKHNIPIIEDAAEAIGSSYQGKKAGSHGLFGVFSFHGSKTITTGEGGMFVTNEKSLYERVLTLSNHGRDNKTSKQFWAEKIGFKYKMSNIEAAIGCAQMKSIDTLIKRKQDIFEYYHSHLSTLPLSMNPKQKDVINGYWMPTIILEESLPFDREPLIKKLNEQHIDARVFFWPLSMLPPFENIHQTPVSYSLYPRGINLPSYYEMTMSDLDYVIETIVKFFETQ